MSLDKSRLKLVNISQHMCAHICLIVEPYISYTPQQIIDGVMFSLFFLTKKEKFVQGGGKKHFIFLSDSQTSEKF